MIAAMFVHVPSRRPPPPPWASPLLVAAWIALFIWLNLIDGAARAGVLAAWGAVPANLLEAPWRDWSDLVDGRLVTLVSALFLHADWLHLIGNVAFLLIFGVSAERSLGTLRFLVLFLLGGAVSILAAALSLAGQAGSVLIGGSGAVSALIGAYLVLFPNARLGVVLPLGLFLEFVRTPASLLIGIWAGLQVLLSFVGPGFGEVAWWAHIAGFLAGIAFAVVSRAAVARRLRQR